MIKKIEQGMKIKCMHCGRTITIAPETFKFDAYGGKYIMCQGCHFLYDVYAYLIHGETVKEEKDA